MSEPRWTPGPWRIDTEYPADVQTSAGEEIAVAFSAHSAGKKYTITGTIPWTDMQGHANARLIAAAPKLYEALALYVAHFGDPLKVALAALAEARGDV